MKSGGTTSRPAGVGRRHAEILQSIVHAYIETGEPVASRTISRRDAERLSAASIRNVMADLSEEGYLHQPHTSAGRVPTLKAFREYVQAIQPVRGASLEAGRLKEELRSLDTVDLRVERSSHVLMQISKSMGIAAAIPTQNQILHQVELLALTDRRVLMLVVTQDRMVRDKVVTVDYDVTQDELHSIRNYINAHFSGFSIAAAQREMKARLEEDRAMYDHILRNLNVLMRKGLLDIGMAPTLHTEGAANLVGFNLHLTREKMRDLLRMLEEKKRILELLERFLESDGEVGVQVGLGDVHPSLEEFALIGVTVQLPGGLSAKIAVLGPVRMKYDRVMGAVYHVGQALQNTAS
jgi:heat-inducible transcriptional repressor